MIAADEIRALLLAKADALVRCDGKALEQLIDPDFVYVNARGLRFDRASYIDTFCTSGKIVFKEQKFSEFELKLFAGFGVATMIVDDRFVASGAEINGHYRSLCVFSGGAGHWLWAAGQTATVG